jgi:nucleoside-diphosphate-sugar epimerase
MPELTYGLTGASGFVGSRIANELRKEAAVRELGRHSQYRFALGKPLDRAVLQGVDVLVHCAWDFTPKSWAEVKRVDVEGSLALFDAARDAGVGRIIYISSMSAFEDTKSNYGRAKLAIEKQASKHHPEVVIVRPGLVYDRQSGGIVGAMRSVMGKLPLVPLIGGGQKFYMCHAEDLAKAVRELSTGPVPNHPVMAAEPVPRTFKQILTTMAAADGRKPAFLPVPHQVAYAGLRAAEALRVPLKLRSDSIIGLINNDPDPQFGGLQTPFREFNREAVRGGHPSPGA